MRRWLLCLFAFLAVAGFGFAGARANDPSKTVGPNACAECHKQEVEAWKGSHHYGTFREMPRNAKGKQIAKQLGVRRIKSESLCLGCHFTVQHNEGNETPVSGISCESCHGAGKEWIKLHSGFSGKTAKTETKAEAQARWRLAEGKGMIRPDALYRLARNCFGCHVVPNEELVNKGGHRAGSAIELLSWSQGEVRHNTWSSKGKENAQASAERRRMLYIIGLGVDLETALRSLAKATQRKVYAFEMAMRADRARKRIAEAARAVPDVPEIAKLVEVAYSAGLKLNNEQALSAAADGVSRLVADLAEHHDGAKLTGLDRLIPGPDKYKGSARKAAAIN
ncbi:MAG: cytochrome c family protein [Hyphomicrobiaceae bacterium]|nr:cytochrome c family protein [Hyphomicrobiaceae bacterium]